MIFLHPNRRDRERSLLLLGVAVVLALAATALGLRDNPPGILLALAAGVALVLVFVHPWRSWQAVLWLAGGGIFAFGVFAELHDLFQGLTPAHSGVGVGGGLLAGVAEICWLLAAYLGPALLVVGLGGAAVRFAIEHHPPHHGAHRA